MLYKIGHIKVDVFKIKNRSGFAAVCYEHLTEGASEAQAVERMEKALRRSARKELHGKL